MVDNLPMASIQQLTNRSPQTPEYPKGLGGGQIPSLNGWRALAIMLVILDHAKFTVGFPIDRLPRWALFFFDQGNLGVRIFFVLSGFLITHLLLKEAESTGVISLGQFFLRRCLRIWPVYFLYLGVLACLGSLNVYSPESSSCWIGALTFTRNMVGPVSSYTGHFWSLAVEEQFYLVWPLCLVACSLWRYPHLAKRFLLVPICLCPLIRMGAFGIDGGSEFLGRVLGGNSILVYADSLAMGCLGAFWIRRMPLKFSTATPSFLFAAALGIVVLGAYWTEFGGAGGRIIAAFIPNLQAVAILIAMWISTQHRNGIAFRILNTAPANTLGVLSYSLYIWHVLFLCNFQGPSLRAILYDWRSWWLAALATAALSYYVVERPMLRLKGRAKTRPLDLKMVVAPALQ
jgi:peptidoglycan/LPS O-acetylase OafA/YrhL